MIIIDMDMPQSCEKCEFFDGEDMCCIDGTYALNPSRISVRPSWCPIKCDIEDIKAEIDEQYKWLMQTKHTLYDIDIAFSAIKSFIDKHIRSDTDE